MNQEEQHLHEIIATRVAMGFESAEDIVEIADEQRMIERYAVSAEWVRARVEEEWRAHEANSAQWSRPTDTAKLAAAFDELWTAHRIVALHRAGFTTSDGEAEVVGLESELRAEGLASEGYCFYHEQDLQRALDPSSRRLFVAYQKIDNEDRATTLRIGTIVADTLRKHGLQVSWDGDVEQRISLEDFTWQKLFADDSQSFRHDRILHR